jgi:hypothetical protein
MTSRPVAKGNRRSTRTTQSIARLNLDAFLPIVSLSSLLDSLHATISMWLGVRRRRVLLAPTRALAQVPVSPLDSILICARRPPVTPCSTMLGSPALRRRSCLCKVLKLFLPELCPVLHVQDVAPGKRLRQRVFLDAVKNGSNSCMDAMQGRKDVQACSSGSLCARLAQRSQAEGRVILEYLDRTKTYCR